MIDRGQILDDIRAKRLNGDLGSNQSSSTSGAASGRSSSPSSAAAQQSDSVFNQAKKTLQNAESNGSELSDEDHRFVLNAMTTRASFIDKVFDPRRDIDTECGYPEQVSCSQFRQMYDRELGKRVVNVYPEETWKLMPKIFEDPDEDVTTPFEQSWKDIEREHSILHYMQRVDEMSGIGQFGLLLLGIDDGRPLNQPAPGINVRGERTKSWDTLNDRKLMYLRVLDQTLVQVASWETDQRNPRYAQPAFYNITLADPSLQSAQSVGLSPDTTQKTIHWSRVIHIADNRTTSEVLGSPRQEPVFNRLYDLRKILGGNGEGMWRGGFPGIALETQAGMEGAEIDITATRAMMLDYMNTLQRYIALTGMSAKTLENNIEQPGESFDVQIKAICATISVPLRVFLGTEEAKLAGEQDDKRWIGRITNRQHRYVTPMIINPTIKRLIDLKVLQPTTERNGWETKWPDVYEPSELDRAEIASKKTEALSKYVAGMVRTLIPPVEYLVGICGVDHVVAKDWVEKAETQIDGLKKETVEVGFVNPQQGQLGTEKAGKNEVGMDVKVDEDDNRNESV